MAGITYDGIPSTEIDSTIFSGTTFSAVTFSGTNVSVTGSASDGQGRLRSAVIGSTTTTVYGGWAQAGSATTSAGSVGFAAFGMPTSDSNYYLLFTGRRYADGTGSVAPWESGTRSTSGVSFIGAASASYNFLVVGT